MSAWHRLPRWLRLAFAWSGGAVGITLPAVYALQTTDTTAATVPMSTGNVTLLILVLGAMTGVTAMIGRQYQGVVSTQRTAMQNLEARVAAQDAKAAAQDAKIEAQNAKIEKLEADLREARRLHLDAEIKHASALGEAKEAARGLEQRIQMLEPLEAKVKVLIEDKRILEELLREKERMLAAKGAA